MPRRNVFRSSCAAWRGSSGCEAWTSASGPAATATKKSWRRRRSSRRSSTAARRSPRSIARRTPKHCSDTFTDKQLSLRLEECLCSIKCKLIISRYNKIANKWQHLSSTRTSSRHLRREQQQHALSSRDHISRYQFPEQQAHRTCFLVLQVTGFRSTLLRTARDLIPPPTRPPNPPYPARSVCQRHRARPAN